jgi:hypothetical protein
MKRLTFFLTAITLGCALALLANRAPSDPNWAVRMVLSMLQS